MVRYADYLIYVSINIFGYIRNLKKIKEKIKITHISAANFPRVAYLVSK